MTGATEVCLDDGGLIDPDAFPCKSSELDSSTITASATSLRAMGESIESKMTTIGTTWNGLAASYRAPEQDAVYTVMAPAETAAGEIASNFDAAATAIETYASEVEGVKATLSDLESRAATFRTEALEGYDVSVYEAEGLWGWLNTPIGELDDGRHIPWNEHGPAIEKNKSLLAEHAAILEKISTAAADCANTINGLLTGVCAPHVDPITADAIMQSTEPMPFGSPISEDRNCSESVGHGLGNFWHKTWTGAASLIGRDAETGDWGWGTAGQSWPGVGDFVLSTALVGAPMILLATAGGNTPAGSWARDRMNTVATGWGSLIGWDHQTMLAGGDGWHAWKEDGVAAGTEALANVGTFFIPGANVAKIGIGGSRAASLLARGSAIVGDIAIPGGSFIFAAGVKGVDLAAGAFRAPGLNPTPAALNALTASNTIPGTTSTNVSQALGLEAPGGAGRPPGGQTVTETPSLGPTSGGPSASVGVSAGSGVRAPSQSTDGGSGSAGGGTGSAGGGSGAAGGGNAASPGGSGGPATSGVDADAPGGASSAAASDHTTGAPGHGERAGGSSGEAPRPRTDAEAADSRPRADVPGRDTAVTAGRGGIRAEGVNRPATVSDSGAEYSDVEWFALLHGSRRASSGSGE